MLKFYRVMLDMRPEFGCPFITLTDPASLQQIVRALKLEGVLPRNARYSSFEILPTDVAGGDTPGDIYINRIAGGDWDFPLRLQLLDD